MVLLGYRRMGKTEIFKRVVDRMFSEQDHADPKADVPVYFEFPGEIVDRRNFAVEKSTFSSPARIPPATYSALKPLRKLFFPYRVSR